MSLPSAEIKAHWAFSRFPLGRYFFASRWSRSRRTRMKLSLSSFFVSSRSAKYKAAWQGRHHAPRQMTEGRPPRPTVASKKGQDRDKLPEAHLEIRQDWNDVTKALSEIKVPLGNVPEPLSKIQVFGMTLGKSCLKSDKTFGSFRKSHRKPECRVCTPGRPCSKGAGCFLLRDSRHSTAGFHAETGPRSVPR